MILIFYNTVWWFITPLLWMGKLFNFPKKWQLPERFTLSNFEQKESIWFHCASIGESKGLLGLLSEIKSPGFNFLITCNTATGKLFLDYQAKEFLNNPYKIILAPLDHPLLINGFIKKNNIKLLCLYEMELWPNYIHCSKNQNVPVILTSGNFNKLMVLNKLFINHVVVKMMNSIDAIQVQTQKDINWLKSFYPGILISGVDFKYSYYQKALDNSQTDNSNREYFSFVSIHLDEVKKLINEIRYLEDKLKVVIIPRELNEVPEILRLLKPYGFKLHSDNFIPEESNGKIIVNTFGRVEMFLKKSRACFVGGTFVPIGGHNLWEPLLLGLPTFVGPFFSQQKSAYDILESAGLVQLFSRKNIQNFFQSDSSINPVVMESYTKKSIIAKKEFLTLLPN